MFFIKKIVIPTEAEGSLRKGIPRFSLRFTRNDNESNTTISNVCEKSLSKEISPLRLAALAQGRDGEGGFVALMSAIIISILLLTITFTLSFTGFRARTNILDAEFKKVSTALAEACVQSAILKIANNPSYGGNETVLIDSTIQPVKECTIISVEPTAPFVQKTIRAQAIYQKSYTNLEIVVIPSPSNIVINSWKELPKFEE